MLVLRSIFNNGVRYGHILSDAKPFTSCSTLFATAKGERLPKGYNAINAYSLFTKEQYKPGTPAIENVKQAAQKWKEMSNVEKEKYVAEAKKETERRREEFKNLPLESQLDLKAKNSNRLANHAKRSYNKANKEQPANAYALFVQEYNKDVKSMEQAAESLKKAAERWKKLSTMDKKKYVDKAENLRVEYQKDLEAWEKKLETEGIVKPVRKLSKRQVTGKIGRPATKARKATTKAKKATTKKAAGASVKKTSAKGESPKKTLAKAESTKKTSVKGESTKNTSAKSESTKKTTAKRESTKKAQSTDAA